MKKAIRYDVLFKVCLCVIVVLLLALGFLGFRHYRTMQYLDGIAEKRMDSISVYKQHVDAKLQVLITQPSVSPAELETLAVYMGNIYDDLIELHTYRTGRSPDGRIQLSPGCSRLERTRQESIIDIYQDLYTYVAYRLPMAKEESTSGDMIPLSPVEVNQLEFIADIHNILQTTLEGSESSGQSSSVDDFFNRFYDQISQYLDTQYNKMLGVGYDDSILDAIWG